MKKTIRFMRTIVATVCVEVPEEYENDVDSLAEVLYDSDFYSDYIAPEFDEVYPTWDYSVEPASANSDAISAKEVMSYII